MYSRVSMIALAAAALVAMSSGQAAAGCGCNKPPPAAAIVRPTFASPGDTVTFFPPENRHGRYDVRFFSADDHVRFQDVKAVYKRDLADGRYKWQVVVKAPNLPPGPTRIELKGDERYHIPASGFTMMQPALALQQGDGETLAKCYSAAVTADNTVLLPLDISAISQRMVFNGLGEGYPLLFSAQDIAIYNTQGFLMQLLGPNDTNIFSIEDAGQPDSFELTYDRHEFVTYREQHAHVNGFGLDPLDPAWHLDGTYHIDHDHLVIAIKGVVENQGLPAPGVTPRFDLSIITALADTPTTDITRRVITWSTACGSAGSGS
jgi:hypothetical protein